MKWPARTQSAGMLLLAAWLIASGVTPFVHLGSFNTGPVLAIRIGSESFPVVWSVIGAAIFAGILQLVSRRA
jgi:hypothetical protein